MVQEIQPQKTNVFVVLNPVAGTSDPALVRSEIEDRLIEFGGKNQIYETTGKDNVREVVKDALQQGYQTFWAAGGDGTVSAVANGLINEDIPMGIIPLGSGNILAKELDIPLDLNEACDLLTGAHQTRVLDTLRVGEDYFVLSVSAGISAFTMAETARQQKRRFGQLAYMVNGARIILAKSLWPFKISIDGQPYRVRASEVIAANAGAIGYKPIRWGSQVRPDDGKVDLCYVRVLSIPGFLSLIGGMVLGRQEHLEELTCNSASEFIEIHSRSRIPVQGDGEEIGYTPVRIEVISHSLHVITPRKEE